MLNTLILAAWDLCTIVTVVSNTWATGAVVIDSAIGTSLDQENVVSPRHHNQFSTFVSAQSSLWFMCQILPCIWVIESLGSNWKTSVGTKATKTSLSYLYITFVRNFCTQGSFTKRQQTKCSVIIMFMSVSCTKQFDWPYWQCMPNETWLLTSHSDFWNFDAGSCYPSD